jgi:Dockerin type I domain
MIGIHRISASLRALRAGRGSSRPPNRHRGRRPWTVEALEDRALLATFTVNSLGDAGAGSGTSGDLRYVITQADQTAGDNTIDFAVTGTITLNSALPDLSNTTGLTDIEGPGAPSLTVARSGAPGAPGFSIFTVDANVEVDLVGLTITGGPTTNASGILNDGTMTVTDSSIANSGLSLDVASTGGIVNEGTMTVTDSTVANNQGGIGGVLNDGTMTVTDSSIANNFGLSAFGVGDGVGGVVNNGTMTVTDSSIANNGCEVFMGSSGEVVAGVVNHGTMTVTDSSIAHNLSFAIYPFYGVGGVVNDGMMTVTGSTIANNSGNLGGVDTGGTMTITDSTIANNSGSGVSEFGGTMTVTNSTIAYNSSGGLVGFGKGAIILYNTIVALNTGSGATASDISRPVSSSSAYNLIGIGGSGGLVNGVNGNQVGVGNPGLGPLSYYGGPTPTIDLLPGSPAIDMGDNALAVDPTTGLPLTTDLRGTGFLRIVNGTVDIGAYEFLPAASDAVAVGWGSQTASLQTASDGVRLLPAGRNTDLPWLGINQLQITLGQAQTLTPADVTVASALGVNYGPVAFSGSGTSYTITLAQPIDAADRVTITIVNPGISLFNGRLDILPGDFNDDGVVNSQDLVGVRNEMLGVTPVTIFGDLNGDGTVDINEYTAVRQRIGTSLPPLT